MKLSKLIAVPVLIAALAGFSLAQNYVANWSVASIDSDGNLVIDGSLTAGGKLVAADKSTFSVSAVDEGDGTNATVTVTVEDADGAALRAAVQFWNAATALGAPSTNNIESVTIAAGTQIQQITANSHYVAITDTNGAVVVELAVHADEHTGHFVVYALDLLVSTPWSVASPD